MTTVVMSPYRVADSPDVGGHFWVYLQYAHGLRRLGCEVFWLEAVGSGDDGRPAAAIPTFLRRLERYSLGDAAILYEPAGAPGEGEVRFVNLSAARAEAVLSRADLLLNFHYAMDPGLLSRFRRTALVDIDPGLLQFWIGSGQLAVAPHDVYLTTGETVGAPDSPIDDLGLRWLRFRPPVCLDLWPYRYDPDARRFTTVSTWLGGEYVTEGKRVIYENDKRVSFLRFVDLPTRTPSELELAIHLRDGLDDPDRSLLEQRGWHVRPAQEAVRTPEMYRTYIQSSRGELSCAKPSCMELQNGWVSDRTLCYLSSGKPAVVQHTGPNASLPEEGDGVFRFSSLDEAAEALAAIEADYKRHSLAARVIAETCFDSQAVLSEMLNLAHSPEVSS
jgi:hypothetical protein